jgi:hypothetical protein
VYVVGALLIRVARADVDVDLHVAVGRMLHERGLPVPVPIAAGDLEKHRYSMWEFVDSDAQAAIDFRPFGASIRVLHAIDVDGVDLPPCDEADWLDVGQNLNLARAAGGCHPR